MPRASGSSQPRYQGTSPLPMVAKTITPAKAMRAEPPRNKWRDYTPQSERRTRPPIDEKPFIAWDGEGITPPWSTVQNYVLFGASVSTDEGAPRYMARGERLTTEQCLDLILEAEKDNPHAIHIGFGMDYDTNQILADLNQEELQILRAKGSIQWRGYYIEHRPRKWLRVAAGAYYEGGKDGSKKRKRYKLAATIYDIITFYATSFEKVLDKYLPTDPTARRIVAEGKAARGSFTYAELEGKVTTYWWEEIQLMQKVAENLRSLMLSVDVHLTQWHGPGAVASYFLKLHKIPDHMSREMPDQVIEASACAYAGGHFELYQVGQYSGTVHSYDLNSAYPYYLSKVPSLANGTWTYYGPEDIENLNGVMPRGDMGVYHIQRIGTKHLRSGDVTIDTQVMQPLFYRDTNGNMHYPSVVDGWYWDPETELVWGEEAFKCQEAWIYTTPDTTRPFAWVADVYAWRKRLKADGNPAELALKLAINSLYGKLAQRVGWDPDTGKPPTWHQLEWAGWLTSATRAALYRAAVIASKQNALIAVETDGIFTTIPLDVPESKEWGDWKHEVFDGILYVQNGVYFKQLDGVWKSKYRGLDPDSISYEQVAEWMSDPATIHCLECAKEKQERRRHDRYHESLGIKPGMRDIQLCDVCSQLHDADLRHTCDRMPLRFQDCTECRQQNIRQAVHTCTYLASTNRFIGYGTAIIGADGRNMPRWRNWVRDTRALYVAGSPGTGKRRHIADDCPKCRAGSTLLDDLHPTVISFPTLGEDGPSAPHELPWRGVINAEVARQQEASDELYRWSITYADGDYYSDVPSYLLGAAC